MRTNMVIRIEHCYSGGDLEAALAEAADFVSNMNDEDVAHVIAYKISVNEPSDGWYVDVVYWSDEK